MEEKETKRVAVYTRKSTEEGLDMEFNSLDAQREAGEAFVASQKSNGCASRSIMMMAATAAGPRIVPPSNVSWQTWNRERSMLSASIRSTV